MTDTFEFRTNLSTLKIKHFYCIFVAFLLHFICVCVALCYSNSYLSPWNASQDLHQPALVAALPPLTSPHCWVVFLVSVLFPHFSLFLCLYLSGEAVFKCAVTEANQVNTYLAFLHSLLFSYFLCFLSLFIYCFLSPCLCSSLLLRFSICMPKPWPQLPRSPLVFSSRTWSGGGSSSKNSSSCHTNDCHGAHFPSKKTFMGSLPKCQMQLCIVLALAPALWNYCWSISSHLLFIFT